MRRIAVLDAPSNLGLRPPTVTSVPGCAKAPGALRDHGLLTRLGARDAGCLTPPRYDPGDWRPGDGVAHAAQIAAYSRSLADRIGAILDADEFPVVLGGDCSILIGSGLAMNRLGEAVGGRIGLVFVDGHSDFRHPGNASYVGAAAGEDLALVTGRGQSDLAAIEGRRPYFRDIDVVVLGLRAQDEYRLDLRAAGIVTRPVPALRAEGAARSAQWARDQLVDCVGYWLHVDVDVLDPAVMPAVDAPSPGGIAFPELELLLAGLVESPHCLGVEITVFDPDYDPDGAYAEEITSSVATGLAAARAVAPRPDLIAARADLATPRGKPAARATVTERPEPDTRPPADAASTGGDAGSASTPAAEAEPVREPAAGARPIPKLAADFGPERVRAALRPPPRKRAGLARRPSADAESVWPAIGRSAEAAASGKLGRPSAGSEEPPTESPAEGSAEPDADSSAEAAAPSPVEPEPATGAALATSADDAPATFADLSAAALPSVEPSASAEAASPAVDDAPAATEEASPAEPSAVGRSTEEASRSPRPLGRAPLLDSEPLPATRPGMLRPRPAANGNHPGDAGAAADGYSLPTQRPGSGEPANTP